MNKMTHGPCVLQGKDVYFVLVPAPTGQGCVTGNPRPIRISHHGFCCLGARAFPAKPSRRHLYLAPNSHSLVPFPNCYRILLRKYKFICLVQSSAQNPQRLPRCSYKAAVQAQHHLVLVVILTSMLPLSLSCCYKPTTFLGCFQDTKSPRSTHFQPHSCSPGDRWVNSQVPLSLCIVIHGINCPSLLLACNTRAFCSSLHNASCLSRLLGEGGGSPPSVAVGWLGRLVFIQSHRSDMSQVIWPRSDGADTAAKVHVTTPKKNKQYKNRFHRTSLSRVLFRSMGNQGRGSSGAEGSTSMCEDLGSILCIRGKKNQTMKIYPMVESTQVIEELVSVHENTALFF